MACRAGISRSTVRIACKVPIRTQRFNSCVCGLNAPDLLGCPIGYHPQGDDEPFLLNGGVCFDVHMSSVSSLRTLMQHTEAANLSEPLKCSSTPESKCE